MVEDFCGDSGVLGNELEVIEVSGEGQKCSWVEFGAKGLELL